MLNRFVHPKSLNMQLCRRRSPSTRTLLLNRLLTSAGEQRQLPLWRRVLCPKVGAQASGGSGEGPFSCACSYIGYAGVPQRQGVDGTLSVDNASFAPPCDRQRLVAKMLLSHDMRYTATGITERDDRCGTRPSGELRSPTPAVHMHMHMYMLLCMCRYFAHKLAHAHY